MEQKAIDSLKLFLGKGYNVSLVGNELVVKREIMKDKVTISQEMHINLGDSEPTSEEAKNLAKEISNSFLNFWEGK